VLEEITLRYRIIKQHSLRYGDKTPLFTLK
jgi:hypothetical protein